jgi:hypothetical protein
MLTLPSSLRVFAKTGPTDMRNYAELRIIASRSRDWSEWWSEN